MDCDPDPILFLLITNVWYRNSIRIYIIAYQFKFKIPVFSHLMQFYRMLNTLNHAYHVLIRGKTQEADFARFSPNDKSMRSWYHELFNAGSKTRAQEVIPRELKSHLLTVLRIRYVYPYHRSQI
jgi:hypothetical protein